MPKRSRAAVADAAEWGKSPATIQFLEVVRRHNHDQRQSFFISFEVAKSSTEQKGKVWHTRQKGQLVGYKDYAIRRGALDPIKISQLVYTDGGLARGLYDAIPAAKRLKIFNEHSVDSRKFDRHRSLREQVSLLDGVDGMDGAPIVPLRSFHTVLAAAVGDAQSRGLVSRKHHQLKSVLLASRPDCPQQLWHTDFSDLVIMQQAVKPLSIIVSLMDGGRLAVPGQEDIILNCGDYIVFGAGFKHAGGYYPQLIYPTTHFRAHAYLGDLNFQIPDETVLENLDV